MKKGMLATALVALLSLTACGGAEITDHTDHITVANAYVRATDEMSEMDGVLMTGVFFEITNSHDEDVVLVGGSSTIAEKVEVHEVVNGLMRMKAGGLSIAGGQTEILKPGGNHVMLIGLSEALVAGDEVTFTLEFSDGHSVDVTAPVKIVNLEQEHYESGSPTASM
jgi:copper(I)-binding protein